MQHLPKDLGQDHSKDHSEYILYIKICLDYKNFDFCFFSKQKGNIFNYCSKIDWKALSEHLTIKV